MNKVILTQEELKEIIVYNCDTGIMTRDSRILGGEITGQDRYLKTMIYGKRYKIHRLAWLYVHGEFPISQIDHINGNRNDNSISNLRSADQTTNNRNAAKRIDNTTGCSGVIKKVYKNSISWIVRIGGSPRINIGSFDNFNDAVIARKMAEHKLGYHKNHGRN